MIAVILRRIRPGRSMAAMRTVILFCIAGLLLALPSCTPPPDDAADDGTPMGVHAFLDTIIQDWEGQDEFAGEFLRLTGIELRITQPPHQQYMDKLLVEIASGSMPDICEIFPEYLPLFVSQGLVVPLDDFIAGAANLDGIDPALLESLRYADGEIYGFPARDGGGNITYIRADWLENLGLPVPRTWDELVEVLRGFTYGDPDGNGVDDTYGITDMHAASRDWYNRSIMLDGRIEMFYDGSRWVDGFTLPQTAAGLQRVKWLYDEGLIDPDFFTNTTYTARNAFFNGQVGVITYWANHWARNLYERTRATVGPQARVEAVPAIEGARYIRRVSPLLVITRGSSDPKRVFDAFIDAQYDKGPVQTLFTYGVEGYHWEMRDGLVSFLPNPEDPYEAPFTKAFVPPNAVLNDWDQPMELDPLVLPALRIINDDPYQEPLRVGGEYYSRYFSEIETELKPDIITRYVLGEYDLDEAMRRYSQRAGELFLDRILAELNAGSDPGIPSD
jgi:putative aldouronate transport system substrate-binding protein